MNAEAYPGGVCSHHHGAGSSEAILPPPEQSMFEKEGRRQKAESKSRHPLPSFQLQARALPATSSPSLSYLIQSTHPSFCLTGFSHL